MTTNILSQHPLIAQAITHKTNNSKKRGRYSKPSLTQLYWELQIEDDRNAETIAYVLGTSKDSVSRMLKEAEELGLIRRDPKPNGARRNSRYRKVKLTGNDGLRAIDLFNAPHYENWNRKTRMQLIKRYMGIGWNVVPVRQDMLPIMDRAEWIGLSIEEKLSYFSDQVFGIGMWIDDLVIFEFNRTDQLPAYNTLTAKTPDGFSCYFPRTPMTRHIYSLKRVGANVNIKAKGSFVVLPPTPGYAWARLMRPSHVPEDLLTMWRRSMLRRKAAASKGSGFKKYVLPDRIHADDRHDQLFRYGRSLRALEATAEYFEQELRLVNDTICDPPLPDAELEAVMIAAWNLPDDPSFVSIANAPKSD